MTPPRVSVVILSWNDGESVRGCLDSVARSDWPNLSILVVDNGSTRYDPRALCAGRAGVDLLLNEKNLGVAGGRNEALRRLLADPATEFVLFLDDDTQHDPAMIRRLVEAWNPDAGRAVLGPSIFELARPEVLTSLGGGWSRWTGRTRHVVAAPAGGGAGAPFPVDFVIGCCFFTHRLVYEATGLFDDRFNLYYGEDVDFCLSAGARGYSSACVPAAVVRHRVSHAAGGARFNPKYAFNKGEKTVRLMKKHCGPLQWATFALAQSVFVSGAALREGARGNLPAVAALVRGMWSGLRAFEAGRS